METIAIIHDSSDIPDDTEGRRSRNGDKSNPPESTTDPVPWLVIETRNEKLIDTSRIRAAVKLMQSTWILASNHKAEHAVGPKWALVMP